MDLIGRHVGEERIVERFMIVPYDIPRRCAATYFPETNVLFPITSVADKSNTPTSKSVVIALRRRADKIPNEDVQFSRVWYDHAVVTALAFSSLSFPGNKLARWVL